MNVPTETAEIRPDNASPAPRRREIQRSLLLEGGSAELIPGHAELSADDELPAGPYGVGTTRWESGDGATHEGMPYTVTCGTGQAVAGHVPSKFIAEAIAKALNAAYTFE